MKGEFVVVGGGIAGVTCVETLAFLEPEKSIILLSESSLIKTVTNLCAITKVLTDFEIKEINTQDFVSHFSNVKVVHDTVIQVDDENKVILTQSNSLVKYNHLCICTGAYPRLIQEADNFEEILGIRDTDSVEIFLEKVSGAKKIMIVGNGGIASELVYKIKNVDIHWVVKDKHISATFVDAGAAEFFQSSLSERDIKNTVCKRMRYQEEFNKAGAALGPDWYKSLIISGTGSVKESNIQVHYEVEITKVENLKGSGFPLEVTLSNNEKIHCDLIISATGVTPKISFKTKNNFNLSDDGGILVNEFMQTNLPYIYAAGDVCSANWKLAKHWFQMKLWSQARQMGAYAAKAMVGDFNKEEVLQDFCFEMFAHSTKLFGHKVILLGLFNGQKLDNKYEILLRMTKGHEYIKFVLENNKLQGAVLIGETDLEEMAENLILNQIDLSPYGDDILNPDIDIEDYFD